MNKLVELNNEQVVTTSLVVAETFGKRHDHVLQDIKNLTTENSGVRNMFEKSVYTNSRNRQYPMYYINRDGFTLLAMGFTGKEALQFKLEYIEAFNAMEQESKQPKLSTKELLLRATNEHEQRIEKLETRVQKAFDDAPINFVQQKRLEDARKKRVVEVLGGYKSNAYNKLARKAFAACSRDVKQLFSIPRYNELPKADYDEAIKFISNWTPDALTQHSIQLLNKQTSLKLN